MGPERLTSALSKHSGCQNLEVIGSFVGGLLQRRFERRLYLRAADVLLSGSAHTGHLEQFKMQRISTSWLGLGVLVALSCGAPAELDEDQFPGLTETGYTDIGTGGSSSTAPPSGTGGATGTGAGPV